MSAHWGIAGEVLADYQVTVGRAAISAGADLVVGHGPHSIHAVEVFAGRLILDSLGNLIFDWPAMRGRHADGLLVEPESGGPTRLRAVRRDHDTRVLHDAEATEVLGRVTSLSAARGTTLTLEGGAALLLCQPAQNGAGSSSVTGTRGSVSGGGSTR